MSGIWVLIVVFQASSFNGVASLSQEFLSAETCEKAKDSVRNKLSSGKIILATCEKK